MTKRSRWSIGAGMGMAMLAASPAMADNASILAQDDDFSNPPVLGQSARPVIGTLLRAAGSADAKPHAGREQILDLYIKYTLGEIYNPSTQQADKVKLRSYTGKDTNPATPYVAPTIEITPGDTLRIKLHNELPPDKDVPQAQRCEGSGNTVDTPHCFNGTNLHTHGLWINPAGNSDNVLISINPQVSFEYEYNIPADHPSGTFWYHPHRHGSTALQVGSGMAGALIIRGDRPPTEKTHGDLDTLVKPFPEKILAFQQIPYACLDGDGNIEQNDQGLWTCKDGEVAVVDSYNQFAPGVWQTSGRFTSINGRVMPLFGGVKTGQTERWRLIHAGVRDTIQFEFRKLKLEKLASDPRFKPLLDGVSTSDLKGADESRIKKIVDELRKLEQKVLAETLCTTETTPYVVAAADGLTMPRAQERTDTVLQPGYRNDLLVNFDKAGLYCVLDAYVKGADSVSFQESPTSILGFMAVSGPDLQGQSGIQRIKDQLLENAEKAYSKEIAGQVKDDLNDGWKLTLFTPHAPVSDDEVKDQPKQDLVFFINTGLKGDRATFEVGKNFNIVQNHLGLYVPEGARPYDPNIVDRKLVVNTAQEWELRSYFVSHPFHIHVNPFEVIKVLDPDGNDVSVPGAREKDGSLSQYAGMKGVWKDTLFVLNSQSPPTQPTSTQAPPPGTYRIFIRTRYERYIGEFVLHCHILDHEDQGMMENVSIGLPDGSGGLATAHHHGG